MTAPIGKGARFLVLTGPLRGQVGIVHGLGNVPDSWCVHFDEGFFYYLTSTLEGPSFKRLPDAPAEVDPIVAEVAALPVDLEGMGGIGGVTDALRNSIEDDDSPDAENDEDWFAGKRLLFVEVAAIAMAGIRAIDRRGTP